MSDIPRPLICHLKNNQKTTSKTKMTNCVDRGLEHTVVDDHIISSKEKKLSYCGVKVFYCNFI